MADVQLEHGHVRIANALFEAIVRAPFTGTQMKIVLCLMRMTYGWHQRSARMSRVEIATACNVAPSGGFDRQFNELVHENVLTTVERGSGRIPSAYAIQKDFEDWGKFSVAAKVLEAHFGARPPAASHTLQGATKAPSVPPTGGNNETGGSGVVAPHRSVRSTPQGATPGPHRGQQNSTTHNKNAELDPPKDIEIQERQLLLPARERAEEIDKYAVGLATAANNAITRRWGEQTRPIRWDLAHQLATELVLRDVPIAIAQKAIVDCVDASKHARPPRTINYFTDAIDDAVKFDQQRTLNAAHPLPPRAKRQSPQRIANVINPEAAAEQLKLEQRYNTERRAAATAWAKDPANRTRYHAIVSAANTKFADTLTTTWGERARNAEVIVECAKAVGFPMIEQWQRLRAQDSNGHPADEPTTEPAEAP